MRRRRLTIIALSGSRLKSPALPVVYDLLDIIMETEITK
jgi:hypothetical protein